MDAAITVRSDFNSTLQWRTPLSANERRPHPSHKRGSPHGCREPLCVRKHRVLCDSYNIQTSRRHSSPTAICTHSLANHTTTASTTAAINNMDAAITMRSADFNSHCLANHTTVASTTATMTNMDAWRTHLSTKERSPHLSHKRGSTHASTPGATLCERTQGFVRFITSKHRWHSSATVIWNRCLANHTTSASATHGGRVRGQTSEDRTRPPNEVPRIAPRATLCERTQGFVRLL